MIPINAGIMSRIYKKIGVRFPPQTVATLKNRIFLASLPFEEESLWLIFPLHRPSKMINSNHFRIIPSFFWPSVPFLLNVTHDKSGKSETNSVIFLVPGLLWWNLRSDELANELFVTRRARAWTWKKVKFLFDDFSKIPPLWQKWVRGSLRIWDKKWYHEVFLFRDEKPVLWHPKNLIHMKLWLWVLSLQCKRSI